MRRARSLHRIGALPVLTLFAVTPGCAPAPAFDDRAPIETRDGVAFVDNPLEGPWQELADSALRFELEQVFGVDETPAEAMLANIRGVAVDDGGNVYILDSQDNRLASFAPDGQLRWSAGREGQGPAEFSSPRALAWDGFETLYVVNQTGARIDSWSTGGAYLNSQVLAELRLPTARRLHFRPPDTLLIERWVPGSLRTEMHEVAIGSTWVSTASFELGDPDLVLPGRTSLPASSRLDDDTIAVGSLQRYEFRLYRLGGELERVVSRPGTGFVPAAIDLAEGAIGVLGEVDAPVRIQRQFWLLHARWPANVSDPDAWLQRAIAGDRVALEYQHAVDLFDDQGRLLLTRTWAHPETPGFGTLVTVDSQGRLYGIVTEPYPQVRRYRLIVNPPE